MTKFVERKKVATRKIRMVEVKLKDETLSAEAKKDLESQREQLEEDLTYIMYYPRDTKYIALFVINDENENVLLRTKWSELKSRAKSRALEERQRDKLECKLDKVQHAIDVEYGVAKPLERFPGQKKKELKESITRGKREKNNTDFYDTNEEKAGKSKKRKE